MVAKKKNKNWRLGLKKEVVQKYVSGAKTAAELSKEYGFEDDRNRIYRWRHDLNQLKQDEQIDDLKMQGYSFEQARKIQEFEAEITEYQKKLAEQIVINVLLKKLHGSKSSALTKSASGLIETLKILGSKKKQLKKLVYRCRHITQTQKFPGESLKKRRQTYGII